ncbi:hypothetical protein C1H46_011127 [Malus baccata]|uniref:Uncharacterized protein n=1 Tax=Malus baccata TaxID=106549 RepID=A0A540MWP9_MALBA|nr:hypothetical protein C1H46_011127 [Malus baccata]
MKLDRKVVPLYVGIATPFFFSILWLLLFSHCAGSFMAYNVPSHYAGTILF